MGQQPGAQQVDTTCGSLLRELQVCFVTLIFLLTSSLGLFAILTMEPPFAAHMG